MKTDDKIKTLGPQLLMAYSGKPGDTVQFAEYVERNIPYFGTMTEVPFAAHSYGAYYFPMSLLDWYHDPEAPLEKGLATLRRCIDEVAKRLVIDPGKTGSRDVEL
ncbi:hypothetical protein K438DRAFT_1910111 [Mycena galopus ATCC 62051]|nr:hypothetical protein K438DRAFT_1910111 [Mycena galopus ATCC 62051]